MKRGMLAIVAAVACATASVSAEAQWPPRTFTNLQIFPKDVGADVVMAAMKNFTRALGVRCQFCHVGEEGMPLEKFDFAADAKPTKQTARAMMRMTAEINSHVAKAITDAAAKGYQVTCFTCHRGAQHPQHAPDAPKPPGR
jgi:photosynthetic reaction center cytochrome c subunit